MPTATIENNGLLDAKLSLRNVHIKSKESYEIKYSYYTIMIVSEYENFGYIGIFAISYNNIIEIHKNTRAEQTFFIKALSPFGARIENSGDKDILLRIRFLV